MSKKQPAKLRPYQLDMAAAVRKAFDAGPRGAPLITLPVGAGRTVARATVKRSKS